MNLQNQKISGRCRIPEQKLNDMALSRSGTPNAGPGVNRA